MAITRRFRKWHFLLLGTSLVLVAAFLWYWNWRRLGIPSPLRAEHLITILSFLMGLFVLGVFIYRLNRKQVTVMLVGIILVDLLLTLVTAWAYRTYPTIFDIVCPLDISEASEAYLSDWKTYFLTPALFAIHAGLLLLWVETLLMFLVHKPTDNPE